MSEIISDGVRSITSDVHGNNMHNFLMSQNDWKVDNHGAERTAEVIEAIGGTDIAVEKNGAANQLATEKTAAAIQLSSSLAFANTQNLLISGFKDGRYDAAVNAAASALAGATNTANIQASLASCCCELREKISEDGQKTRDLINSIDSLKNATELAEVKMELALSKIGKKD